MIHSLRKNYPYGLNFCSKDAVGYEGAEARAHRLRALISLTKWGVQLER